MFVPQAVPFALLPPSTQVIAPVAQDVVPFLQLLVGFVVHAVPAVHAPHVPLLQTRFVPHAVPFALLPPSTQVIVPVAHDVVPFLQLLVGFVVHAEPAVHAPHPPLLQTMFVPHELPFGLLPASTHVMVPVRQDVAPFLQLLVGLVVHAVPAVHARQVPPLQTMFVPQAVPFALLLPSTQVIVPVEQDVVPFLQLLVGLVTHAEPAVHALHVPLLQTPLVPHEVPFATFPVSAQTDTPVTHDVAPVRHGFVGWQLDAGRARATRPVVADAVRAARGAVHEVPSRVGAGDRGRAGLSPGVARVRGRTGDPRRARHADPGAAHQVRTAGGAVGDVRRLDADRRAGVARRGAGPAGLAGHGTARAQPCNHRRRRSRCTPCPSRSSFPRRPACSCRCRRASPSSR